MGFDEVKMRQVLEKLTNDGLKAIADSQLGFDGFRGATAFHDSSKDELVTQLPAFTPAVEALAASEQVKKLLDANEARRLALQFVFNTYSKVRYGVETGSAFNTVWTGFEQELATPTWTFAAVANLQNIDCSEPVTEIAEGISIRARSFSELGNLLRWPPERLHVLADDWHDGTGASSFVLFLQKRVPKAPENFRVADDGTTFGRAVRALLSLRLAAPGDVRIGRLFLSRPAAFNFGIGAGQSIGTAAGGDAGTPYMLTPELATSARAEYEAVTQLDEKPIMSVRNLALAIRSFSAMYDRHFHQVEDRVIDAITALEALWKVDAELTFRLSFRTASLLGADDEERAKIYDMVSQYYQIRSRIVHGRPLNENQGKLALENEPIRAIVRRTLRAFIHLANHPGEWTLKRVDKEADVVLLHSAKRNALRKAMDLPDEPVPPLAPAPQGIIASLNPLP